MEIKGYVDNIIFRNDGNGYTVFTLVSGKEEITCVGSLPVIDPGETLKLTGDVITHPVYGEQFKFGSYERISSDDKESLQRYLGSGAIKGIGEKLAARMTDHFGERLADIIENEPERLSEIKGISEKKAREIGVLYREKKDTRDAFVFLSKYGLSNNMSILIYEKYGDEIYRIMRDNPYRLAEDVRGIGFKKADEIARKAGIEADSTYRIACGILYEAHNATSEGDVYLPLDRLLEQTSELLGVDPDLVMEGVENLTAERKLIIRTGDGVEPHVYASEYYYAELKCAALLRDLYFINSRSAVTSAGMVDSKLNDLEKEMGIEFDDLQREAVHAAASEGIVIVTGGPGTGKTTTIRAMIRYFNDAGMDVMLAAPTGRAAKRMTEATGYEAKTIHRMLELSFSPEEDSTRARFERNEDNPLETDVVILDEMSMVDMFLFRALLLALSPGTRLIMVGDMDQLPSVGPGQVLRDLCESEVFRLVKLDVIFRQSGDSDIVMGAHEIRAGRYPKLNNQSKDLFFLERHREEEIYERIKRLISTKSGNDTTPSFAEYVGASGFDIQILTPMRKGSLGSERLNEILQEFINPPDDKKSEIEIGSIVLREGDKVMQIKNDYQAEWEITGEYNIVIEKGNGIFNGDLGRIKAVDERDRLVTVEFDEGKTVVYDYPHLEELELAYAITIHKSQGSEYPAVIIPILSGPRMLMNRNLLYTAITRAKKCVVILGSERAVRDMVDNSSVNLRNTGLSERIKEMMQQT